MDKESQSHELEELAWGMSLFHSARELTMSMSTIGLGWVTVIYSQYTTCPSFILHLEYFLLTKNKFPIHFSINIQSSQFIFLIIKIKHLASNQISSQETRICHSVKQKPMVWWHIASPLRPLFLWSLGFSLWLRATTSVSVRSKQNSRFFWTRGSS